MTSIATDGPRRKTAPGSFSPAELVMDALSFRKPILEPKRSWDWTVMERRA